MIRVLHVLCDLSGGGAERLVLGLCREGLVHQEVATVHAQPDDLAEDYRRAGVRVHRGARARGTSGFAAILELTRLAHGFDIVHTHLFAGDTWGRPAARIARKPVVTTEHNLNRDENATRTWIKRGMASSSDRLVYVSEAARRYAEAHEHIHHPHAVVIPNGIDLARFSRPSTGPATRLLAIGRDVPQKGFDVLVRALPAGTHLRIAGRSTHRGVRTVAVPGGTATVDWLGPRDDIPDLLADSDILVVPSRWEGFGLAALEGMTAGVPVVASNVDGLAELIGDAGVLVPKDDPDALRDALVRLLADAPERARLADAGRARAALFSLAACARRYAALYAELAPTATPW